MNNVFEGIPQIRNAVLTCARKAYASGLVAGTSGNFSFFSRALDIIAITASGVRYDNMGLDDILVLNPRGSILAGNGKPSSELPMHMEIYRAMPDVQAIAHTHSPYATAFAAAERGIPCALIEMVYSLGGDIKCAPLAIPGTAEVGIGAVKALDCRGACLLANHGAVAVGEHVHQALLRAEYAEDAAKICHLSMQIGGLQPIDETMISRMKGK